MRLRAGAATDVGRLRRTNEDSFASRLERGLFIVCDGMGGAAAGEVASQLAVETVLEELDGRARDTAGVADRPGYLRQTTRLSAAIEAANQRIYERARADTGRAGMGTTIVSAWIAQNVASVAHVGDSRAYLWHEGRFEQLTTDHSLVEEEVRAGLVDRAGSLQTQHQNVLLRALGGDREVDVDISEVPVRAGNYLLLCTDGLTRMVADEAMSRAISELREPQRICESLIEAANNNGGPDNVTVVVVKILGGWWRNFWRRR